MRFRGITHKQLISRVRRIPIFAVSVSCRSPVGPNQPSAPSCNTYTESGESKNSLHALTRSPKNNPSMYNVPMGQSSSACIGRHKVAHDLQHLYDVADGGLVVGVGVGGGHVRVHALCEEREAGVGGDEGGEGGDGGVEG